MSRLENVELTMLCLIRRGEEFLLQDRKKEDWKGFTLPGGHVEKGESFVDAVIREMKEETGLSIRRPKLCGIKQFPVVGVENSRYVVLLFLADEFEGELRSSEEGQMHWVRREDLPDLPLVPDFEELLQVMLDESLTEFQYVIEGDKWNVIVK